MKTFIALFQGINVGGNHVLPMKELRALLEGLGCANVRTYIQSGNAVFESDRDEQALGSAIGEAVEKARGFRPSVFLLGREELDRAIVENPFPEAANDPKSLHLFFLESHPSDWQLDRERLDPWRKDNERFELRGSILYLHVPDGIGRSKLAAKLGRLIKAPMTARNWRTVRKLREMADERASAGT